MQTRFTFQPNTSIIEPIQIAKKLRPLLQQHADEAEQAGKIPDVVFDAIQKSGLFLMMAPRRFGGYGCKIITHMQTIAELAKGCAGSAWAFGLLSGCSGAATAMAKESTDLIFKTGKELLCSVSGLMGTATPTKGGYIVNGKWGYASGCMHADWALNGVKVLDSNGTTIDTAFAAIPLINNPNVSIQNTWNVLGVKASGSNTVIAEDLFIPKELLMLASAAPTSEYLLTLEELEPRERMPVEPLFPLGVLSPTLGSVMAMQEYVKKQMIEKKIVGWNYPTQSESHTYVKLFGEATMEIDSAWLHIERAAKMLDETAQETPLTGYDKARIQADSGYAMQQIRNAGNKLMDIAGPSGFSDSSPMQRYWRDLSFASRHSALNSPLSLELYGRAELDLPSNIALLPNIKNH
ncbi:MAG: acyl-CoA dehydrogenase family protein [Spongiibacteraceae bacterium]